SGVNDAALNKADLNNINPQIQLNDIKRKSAKTCFCVVCGAFGGENHQPVEPFCGVG
ncbi:hypothetical protein KYT35_004109, partial [Escherichia coli]|nr:hypothetical protein [Shigella sonnei]EHT8803889.1 hypothetical protein [Escherichia coli]HCX7396427.1 hypothetical protein [Escherichia coli]